MVISQSWVLGILYVQHEIFMTPLYALLCFSIHQATNNQPHFKWIFLPETKTNSLYTHHRGNRSAQVLRVPGPNSVAVKFKIISVFIHVRSVKE